MFLHEKDMQDFWYSLEEGTFDFDGYETERRYAHKVLELCPDVDI